MIPDPERKRILTAMAAAKDADTELKAAVVAGLLAGGSVREMADLTGMSTNTIQRWGRDGGWPSKEQQAARATRHAEVDEWQASLDAANAMIAYVEPSQEQPRQNDDS